MVERLEASLGPLVADLDPAEDPEVAERLLHDVPDAPGQGKLVWQMGADAAPAARETELLFRELLGELVQTTKLRRKG